MTQPDQTSSLFSTEARYRLLLEAVTDYAIYMLDANGVVASWNTGAQRLKGYTEAEIIGQHFSRFYPAEDVRAGMPERTLETARREGRFEAEGWRVAKGGRRFWAHVVVDPIRTPSGDTVGYAKVTRDLSERLVAQESLERREEEFRLLVQGVTDYAIYMLDPKGVVTNWNAGAQRIKGYLPEEVIGTSFSRFYREADRRNGDPQRALATAAREGRFESEGWRVRKDGTEFWANVVVDPIRDPAGKIIGFAKITRDVTEKRQAQQALELAREALFQSQKLDAIGQLTGGVAHDFNNLLMVVLSSLQLAQRRLPPDEKLGRLIDNAIQGAQRGVSLTQRMLAFARRQQLDPVAVDLASLVEGMNDLLSHSLGPTVLCEVEIAPGLSPVLVDANQLELAILNLAVNARDALPDGGRVLIAAREAAADAVGHRLICLSVSDDGNGMDAATLDRAMEPFFTTKGAGKGTGLGLSMVHGLAGQSGGRFVLKSTQGQGTTAELWLPVAEVAGQLRADAISLSNEPYPPAINLSVVAVDDDKLVLMGTAAMLEELGHTVLPAASGREALDLLRHGAKVDLLITDQVMPGLTGLQLIELVREDRPQLPAVLATGFGEESGNAALIYRRLAKPFDQEALRNAIDVAMAEQRLMAAAASPAPG